MKIKDNLIHLKNENIIAKQKIEILHNSLK